jgi:hypothetical protein
VDRRQAQRIWTRGLFATSLAVGVFGLTFFVAILYIG